MQYPPGTGFLLALFPQGLQVVPLFVLATVIIFGFALLAHLLRAPTTPRSCWRRRLAMSARLYHDQSGQGELFDGADHGGLRARRISHGKTVCWQRRSAIALLLTMLIGLSARSRRQFQVGKSACSSAGYCLFFLLRLSEVHGNSRHSCKAWLFGVALLGGHGADADRQRDQCRKPFATTYGGPDVVPPALSLAIALALCRRHAVRVACACRRIGPADLLRADRQRRQARRR